MSLVIVDDWSTCATYYGINAHASNRVLLVLTPCTMTRRGPRRLLPHRHPHHLLNPVGVPGSAFPAAPGAEKITQGPAHYGRGEPRRAFTGRRRGGNYIRAQKWGGRIHGSSGCY